LLAPPSHTPQPRALVVIVLWWRRARRSQLGSTGRLLPRTVDLRAARHVRQVL
jgi:hypothetical protein